MTDLDKSTSQLDPINPLTGDELIAVTQGGQSRKTLLSQVVAYLMSGNARLSWGNIIGTLDDQEDLHAALAGKANTGHTHAIAQITNLQAELNNRSLVGHTHTQSQVSGLVSRLSGIDSGIQQTNTNLQAESQTRIDFQNRRDNPHQVNTGQTAYSAPFSGAQQRTQADKNAESVSVMDFGAIGDNIQHTVQEWYTAGATYYRGYANLAAVQAQYPHVTGASYLIDQAAIEAASIALAAGGGGSLIFPRGKYFYRRLTIRSGVIWRGAGSHCTLLTCVDNATLDSGVTFGSSIRKPDDGTRAFRAGFFGVSFWTGSAGTASNQVAYQNVAAINLCACERTNFYDVTIGGFGYGALILARAEGGAEGLGFVNTVQDGNYNTGFNLSFAGCGKYNPEKAVIWFRYKANSNKLYGVFAKGCTDAYLAIFTVGNDNAIIGGALESSAGVARIATSALDANGNYIEAIRVEGASEDAYFFGASAENNTVIGGYHTGVVGQDFNMVGKNNRVIADTTNHLRVKPFPPPTSYSTLHNLGVLRVTALNGDVNYPLYIKAETADDPLNYPKAVFYNDVTNGAVGNVLGRLSWSNRDTSGGALGESAAIEAVLEDSAGATGLSFLTGTGTTLSEKLRIRSNGAQDFVVPTTALTLTKNGTMNFRLVSDTSLQIRVRGSDGVTRTATLTLA